MSAPRIKPQLDPRRRRVCNVCGPVKRQERLIYTRNLKRKHEDKHGEMWHKVRADIREIIEIEFERMFEWRCEMKRSEKEIAMAFRKIEYGVSWMSCDDGDLRKHYKNWRTRYKRKWNNTSSVAM